MKLRWSPKAGVELRDYVQYLRERNPAVAREAKAELTEVGRKLRRNPYIGRPGTQLGERLFSVPRWGKVFVYDVLETEVVILTLRDTRMQNTDES